MKNRALGLIFTSPAARIGALALVSLFGLPSAAMAEGFDLQQLNPAADQLENIQGTHTGNVGEHGTWRAFAIYNHCDDPLVYAKRDGERIGAIVESQGTLHLLGSLALFDMLEVGLDIPMVTYQGSGEAIPARLAMGDAGFGLGDIRLAPKVQLWTNRAHNGGEGLAVAFLADVFLPTGDSDVFQGGEFRFAPRLAADYRFAQGPRVAANFGVGLRPQARLENLEVGDTLNWSVAGEVPVTDSIAAMLEFQGKVTPGGGVVNEDSPAEVLAGGKGTFMGKYVLLGGAGLGLVNGYGTPDWRLYLGGGIALPKEVVEVAEPTPECTADNVASSCTAVPATECADGVIRSYAASCTAEGTCAYDVAEVACADGFMCGETDGQVACVAKPECFADADCSAPAASCTDGVVSRSSASCQAGACVVNTETITCEATAACGEVDGAPACVASLVRVSAKKIELAEQVYFETSKAIIQEVSFPLLNEVARILSENPQITKIRVEGHTDNRGRANRNLTLSKERAASVVEYLKGKGISADRMVSEGYGQERPIADNETDDGRSKNRRVAIEILEQSAPAVVPPVQKEIPAALIKAAEAAKPAEEAAKPAEEAANPAEAAKPAEEAAKPAEEAAKPAEEAAKPAEEAAKPAEEAAKPAEEAAKPADAPAAQ